jgi:tetratricopeptide (TPR) repeat protein
MLASLRLMAFGLTLAVSGVGGEALAFQANKPSDEAKQHYVQARKLLLMGEKEKALEELKATLRLAPEFVEAHRDFLDNQRDKAESFVEQYEGYLKQHPGSAVYHYLLGKVYSNANKRERADALFQKALELDPEFGWAMLAVSNIATRSGDTARAIELWEKACKNAGESVALRSIIANNFVGKKMYERALQESDRILQIDPNHFDAHIIKWQSRMNITFGADQTRAEVLREIQSLEANHGKNISALLAVQSGYQMLENEEGNARAKKTILAIDPKYFERQPSTFSTGTATGKVVRITGPNARLFGETYSMKDEKQKLEVYTRLEKALEDADARLYAVYPAMLRSYLALKDMVNAERVVDLLTKGGMEPLDLARHQVTLARAYLDSKSGLDTALDHVGRAVEQLRKPPPMKEGGDPQSAEYANESAKKDLARALHLRGQILLEKGMTEQAAGSLGESAELFAQEESLFDLGTAYSKLGKADQAIDALSRAYAFEGKRGQAAKISLEKIYGSTAHAKPVAALLTEAVERHRAQVRETAINKALREIARIEAKEAPAFSLATVSGQKVQLADLRGKVVLLNFWATW